jgi:RNA polymerase sigma-70 factor (ECF subfamily)
MIIDITRPRQPGRWRWWRNFGLIRPSAHPSATDQEQRAEASQQAFEALFGQFERRIFGYLWRVTGDEQSALDLTQETFLRAWQHFQQIAAHRDNGAWLFRVASNLAMSHLRRRSLVMMQPLEAQEPGASDPGHHIAERDAVRQTLRQLTPRQRATLVLHEVYGFACDEIAPILGISRDAVKMTLWRAREAFRTLYGQEGNS